MNLSSGKIGRKWQQKNKLNSQKNQRYIFMKKACHTYVRAGKNKKLFAGIRDSSRALDAHKFPDSTLHPCTLHKRLPRVRALVSFFTIKGDDMPRRVYPQRILDLIENELYEELKDLDAIDEETVLAVLENEQQDTETKMEEAEEARFQKSLSIPAGVIFDPSDIDNLPPLRNGICTIGDGLDNVSSIPPLFGGKHWPLL
jgi:hypothetical protein